MNFITENKIPLGRWMETGVDWLTIHAATFFDTVSYLLETIILSLVDVFKWMPPAVPILVTAAIAWYLHRQISLVVFVIAALLLILNLGYWQEMLETFVLVFAATTISVLIGVPLGIIAAHRPWLYTLMRPILDLMQTVPTFVYL
ncbi:choline ABC transporter permease subunit, partial [Vibrio anguillarum]|nr:choline ABC transporter permease subunit [Vibrio anguillarum]